MPLHFNEALRALVDAYHQNINLDVSEAVAAAVTSLEAVSKICELRGSLSRKSQVDVGVWERELH